MQDFYQLPVKDKMFLMGFQNYRFLKALPWDFFSASIGQVKGDMCDILLGQSLINAYVGTLQITSPSN